ncbi:hypothetical protein HDG38_000823 [Paraburkholderia sp. WSM4177]|nr:hypothetical protein [Paraburkholderia sp. WSM4177]MBB5482964.1 hypothetical protein [Paraburkholderia sp. WSM4180]
MFDFTEIREQVARHLHELLKAVLERGIVEQPNVTGLHAGDFFVDLAAPRVELGKTLFGVRLAAFAHLPQQLEKCQEPRFRADKAAFRQRAEPRDRFLRGGCQVELRFIGTLAIVLAQPSLFRAGPVVQILERRLREGVIAELFAQRVKLIFECFGKKRSRHHAHVWRDEHAVQEADSERRVVGA